jgi:hypothetical protein
MPSSRRRFESDGEAGFALQQDEVRLEVEEQEVVLPEQEVPGVPEVATELEEGSPQGPEAPAAYLLALPGALLRKQDGTTEAVEAGTLLSTSGWVPLGEGLVAVNLGELGKWTVLVSEWVVYFKG